MDYEDEIPDAEKVQIAKDFLANAPPGEFNEVFNDVRVLLDNDGLLKQAGEEAFATYNEDQFMIANVEDENVLVTSAGRLDDGRYVHPAKSKVFSFDHLRRAVQEVEDGEAPSQPSLRDVVEEAAKQYAKEHYPEGIVTVYGKPDTIVLCLEDHQYQPHNFWNGKWRAQWTLHKDGKVEGVIKTQVHYYEDGNVQLRAEKQVEESISTGSDKDTTDAFMKCISKAESSYQNAVSDNYNTMSSTTFKALRRALPITRQKVDWNKILNYKIGQELKK